MIYDKTFSIWNEVLSVVVCLCFRRVCLTEWWSESGDVVGDDAFEGRYGNAPEA